MKGKIESDKKKRRLINQYELKRLALKIVLMSSKEHKLDAMFRLSELPRNSSITRMRNRCILSGRSRGIIRQFKISRIKVKDFVDTGNLTGVQKSSW
jgi:small subunit ribosomal protein S14